MTIKLTGILGRKANSKAPALSKTTVLMGILALSAMHISAHAADLHYLKVKKNANTWKSIFAVYRDPYGGGHSRCLGWVGDSALKAGDWINVGDVQNGTDVSIQPFSSNDCTNGSLGGRKTKKVPGNDGLTYFWFTY